MADSLLDLSIGGVTLDVLRIMPNWASQPESDFDFGREVIQYDEGATAFRHLTDDLGWRVSCDFTNGDKADEFALLSFFHSHKGRLNRFWLPVQWQYFTPGAKVTSGSTNFTLAPPNSFLPVHQGYERLFILLQDGSFITRRSAAIHPGLIAWTPHGIGTSIRPMSPCSGNSSSADSTRMRSRWIRDDRSEHLQAGVPGAGERVRAMTLAANEALQQQTDTAELYHVNDGDTDYYFTSCYRNLVANSMTYCAIPVQLKAFPSAPPWKR